MSVVNPDRLAAIFGCAGTELTDAEAVLFRSCRPTGLILFFRNCDNPQQIKGLINQFKELIEDDAGPVLIDQEGGRVQRLQPPTWRQAPAAAAIAALAARAGIDAALRAAWLNARLIADELQPLGFTVNCAPCLDLRFPDPNPAIGDRAYGGDPVLVSRFGRAVADGLLAGGILPVIKHMPGHGRARVDSHHDLPIVEATADVLRSADFMPFKALSELPLGMSAHLLYQEIDADNPGTLSAPIIEGIIRREIGFDGLLFTDDISMNALPGGVGTRAARAIDAGCDIVVHCNGEMSEMTDVADTVGSLSARAHARLTRALATLPAPAEFDPAAALAELKQLLNS